MKPSIYIVDDNEMMREFLASYLETEYQISTFGSAEALLAELKPGYLPDLILADYSLEGLDGLNMLNNLKTSGYFQDIPVVFVSGQQKSDTRIKCLEGGAEDFITKPFNPQELALKLRKILGNKMVSA